MTRKTKENKIIFTYVYAPDVGGSQEEADRLLSEAYAILFEEVLKERKDQLLEQCSPRSYRRI